MLVPSLDPLLAPFSDLFASHFSEWFLHWFFMDFWLILGPLNLEFWRFYCRRVAKIEKSPFPKFNQFFIDFGPHFGSLFGPFWHKISTLFRHGFWDAFLDAIFQISDRKWAPKGSKTDYSLGPAAAQNAPKTHPRRNLDFSSILHRSGGPFCWIFQAFWAHIGQLFGSFAVFAVSKPVKPSNLDSPASPRGAAVSALRSQLLLATLLASIFRFFRKRRKCSRLYVFQ